jgi:hypothetical protein
VTETYYDVRVAPGLNLALNYQLAVNPAYNADRGPVHLFAIRARIAFLTKRDDVPRTSVSRDRSLRKPHPSRRPRSLQ